MASFTLLLALSGFCLYILYKLFNTGRRESFLPPGPPTLPVLGNLLSFPTAHPWYKLTEMAREYGDIYSLKMFSGTFVVLSSPAVIHDVIDKNSRIVSDRPPSHISDLINSGKHIGAARYGDEWRRLRRCTREVLTVQACRNHLKIQQAEAIQLMHDFLTKPQHCYHSIRRFSTSVILSLLYGSRAPRLSTPEVVNFFESQRHWIQVMEPGATPPIDLFPLLKLMPERWASWKTEAKITRHLQRNLYFGLLEKLEQRLSLGTSSGCWMEGIIERAPGIGLDRDAVGQIGGTLIEGGADTTSSFIQSLILALVNFPEAQRLAQEEIDRVVGDERCPVLDDIDNLPYIQAVVKEVIRWRPPAPLALPHATTEDIFYKEYIIPKGSIIFLNNWAIFHDPAVFKDPAVFNPGRWLTEELASNHVADLVFGCARRICPGIHLAKNSMNINAMNFIWGFNFSKSKDPATGQDKVYDLFDFARGIVTGPNYFECSIEARSAQHAGLIRRDFLEASSVFEEFEHDLNAEDSDFVRKTREDVRNYLNL